MSMLTSFKKPTGKMPRVVLCESFDQRVLRAAHTLNQHKLAQVVLLGDYDELDRAAVGCRADLDGIDILDYESDEMQSGIKSTLESIDADGAFDPTDPVVAGAWLVRTGLADMIIAGAATTPTHVMRVYLKMFHVAEGCETMSGISLVAFEDCRFVRHQLVGMADVSVVAEPTPHQLADIAIQSAASYERMTGIKAKVAFLSFSTLGSSDLPAARRVREAVEITRSEKPDLIVDGEMQLDAALVSAVAGTKSPASPVAGSANVLVFPNLSAGNIAMKIFQRFSNYRVLGPILQGLDHPCSYISRGASAEDIVDQVRLLQN
ncbi:MAG: phosphate acyltransferase [Armatimonadota bacterium]